MRHAISAVTLLLCVVATSDAWETPPQQGFRYPRVYGPTGHPYGPTQAHYQYMRQYGRPWHGQGGITSGRSERGFQNHHDIASGYRHHSHWYGHRHYGSSEFLQFDLSATPGYGYGYGLPGYFHYGPVFSYVPMAPVVRQAHPLWIGPNPFDNDVLRKGVQENQLRWEQPLIVQPAPNLKHRPAKSSTPRAKLKSIRAQGRGDVWFRKQNYLQAYSRYKTAVSAAQDRAEPHFRLAYALSAMGRYSLAVKHIKRGLALDPTWPATGASLSEIFGEENQLAKSSVVHKVIAWTREDIRDPDRLFLLGVLLYFDDDERSATLFETALRLAGSGDHLHAFLRSAGPGEKKKAAAPGPAAKGAKPAPIIPPAPGPPRPAAK